MFLITPVFWRLPIEHAIRVGLKIRYSDSQRLELIIYGLFFVGPGIKSAISHPVAQLLPEPPIRAPLARVNDLLAQAKVPRRLVRPIGSGESDELRFFELRSRRQHNVR